jgi:hypothetical protein
MEVAQNPPIQEAGRTGVPRGRPSGFQPHGQLTEFQSKLKEAARDQWFVENAAKAEYKWVQDARGLWVDAMGDSTGAHAEQGHGSMSRLGILRTLWQSQN